MPRQPHIVVLGLVAAVEAVALVAVWPSQHALAAGVVDAVLPAPETLPRPVPPVSGGPRLTTRRFTVEGLDGSVLLDVQPFDAYGEPRPEAFAAIAHAFRARNDHLAAISPLLVEKLMMLSAAFDGRPLALVSGHRVAGRGTRKTSYHVRGMAADVLIRGVRLRELYLAAKELEIGGLGVYPTFLHIDVRHDSPYRWGGAGGATWPLRSWQ